jgi:Cft2 family RNA processing exonuclease
MVSIRDYAKMNNVSYEAIRQQVKRYEDELNGHIIKQNRTQFLDDVAVDILDQHRKENPVVIINKDTDSRLKQLEDENKNLLIKVAQQADKISQLNEDLKNKIEQMTSLMLENKEKTSLLEQKKDQAEEINQLKEQMNREKKEQLNEIEKLKNDPKVLFDAIKDADEIVDYIKDIEDFEKYISLSEIEQETLDTIEEDMDELEMEM